ncbi:uncharacterized protein B0H18DRAFT_1122638 [Fomitopsis serialis]|uniref:uncharacterized protein n=1 Tax=Fomitopsis serialis TaxID=139415 RepID=UPI002007B87E|nr:uncharacterized protein B0H18DRAFT_1122638 [Neoantrodia serialis]KAH9919274.1 hypothetical protein B0H18DRAFT_1122638 [Neoantrodia serialis]
MKSPPSSDTDSDNGSARDTDSYGSEPGSEPSVPGSDWDNTQPGTPIDPQQPAHIALYSPGHSFEERDHLILPRSLLHDAEGSQPSLVPMSTGPSKSLSAGLPGGIPPKFWDLLNSGDLKQGEYYRLREHFYEIRKLQLEWEQAGCKGFDITVGMNERSYALLQQKLDQSWEWSLGDEGEHDHWVAFLRCTQLDFWPTLGKAVAIAPTFEEELTYLITNHFAEMFRMSEPEPLASTARTSARSIIKTPDVYFSSRYNTVYKEAIQGNSQPASTPFLCLVAQTVEEFIYNVKKMVSIVESKALHALQGFILVLVKQADGVVGADRIYHANSLRHLMFNLHTKHGFGDPKTPPQMECGVLFYGCQQFPDFLVLAKQASTMQHWEKGNFMWFTGARKGPQAVPSAAWELFEAFVHSTVATYAAYVKATGCYRVPPSPTQFPRNWRTHTATR